MIELKPLLNKRFKVIVGDEVERTTNFMGLLQLLCDYSYFFSDTIYEQRAYIKESIKQGYFDVDAIITCKII